jgi:hypothetical protein
LALINIGGNDYFSYATLADANIYLAPVVGFSTWDEIDDDIKGGYLIQAARFLDTLRWLESYDTQAERLAVPNIVNASIEIAFLFSSGDISLLGLSTPEAEVKRLKAGSVEVENFRNIAKLANPYSIAFPQGIFALLRAYLSNGLIASAATSFGTDALGGSSVYNGDFAISP